MCLDDSPHPNFSRQGEGTLVATSYFLLVVRRVRRRRPSCPAWSWRWSWCAGPDRQAATVSQAAVRADVHQTAYVHVDFAPEIAFDHLLAVDYLANPVELRVRQFAEPSGCRAHRPFRIRPWPGMARCRRCCAAIPRRACCQGCSLPRLWPFLPTPQNLS